jgi:hypothetical protein
VSIGEWGVGWCVDVGLVLCLGSDSRLCGSDSRARGGRTVDPRLPLPTYVPSLPPPGSCVSSSLQCRSLDTSLLLFRQT